MGDGRRGGGREVAPENVCTLGNDAAHKGKILHTRGRYCTTHKAPEHWPFKGHKQIKEHTFSFC